MSIDAIIPNWFYDQVTMALLFNNNHKISYHMDAQWSIGFAWIYFTNPDYSVV